ncbi:hypothetical protein [Verrucosispora sp. WMMD573]|uniref:hypothetical protein n=1 Tax=Verrucosispora sp. WMMD573 TaxID=3015149 RepID=UPI00248AFC22|nr:hypothetical protein [Verrucosispora sp. WMMD573]WBB55417.1 hypothetical protein O7601_04650 [Verrucosispora sp. WMMD573]
MTGPTQALSFGTAAALYDRRPKPVGLPGNPTATTPETTATTAGKPHRNHNASPKRQRFRSYTMRNPINVIIGS